MPNLTINLFRFIIPGSKDQITVLKKDLPLSLEAIIDHNNDNDNIVYVLYDLPHIIPFLQVLETKLDFTEESPFTSPILINIKEDKVQISKFEECIGVSRNRQEVSMKSGRNYKNSWGYYPSNDFTIYELIMAHCKENLDNLSYKYKSKFLKKLPDLKNEDPKKWIFSLNTKKS